MPEMQQQLKSSKVSVPQNLAALMVSTHPTQVVNGVKREFLKPESTLHFIPRGRAARGKGAEHMVYRRTLQINKEAFSSDCKEQLEKGELQYNATNLPKSSVKFLQGAVGERCMSCNIMLLIPPRVVLSFQNKQ